MHCLTYFKLCLVNVQCLLRVFCVYKKSSNHVWLHFTCGSSHFAMFFELCAVKIQYLFSVYMLLAFRRRLNPFIKTFQTLSGPSDTFLVAFIFVTRNISNYLFLLLMFLYKNYVSECFLNICCKHISQFSDDIETFLTLFVVYFPITARNSSLLVTN